MSENNIIYIFNARDDMRYSLMKDCFNLSDKDIYDTIKEEFDTLNQRLTLKDVAYEGLKGALLPNQEKNKSEICLIIDTTQIDSCSYGYYVFSKLLPVLDKDSTYSILSGDYIDCLNSQIKLKQALDKIINRVNNSNYRHSTQYYLIYFNRLTQSQLSQIIENMKQYPWFTGYADVSHRSFFKAYLSHILVHSFIKCKSTIISSHPADYSDEENINMSGYPFTENGYKFVSINDDSYAPFLSYKIESDIQDEDDNGFSFNALTPKFDSIDKLKLKIDDKKWYEYLTKTECKGEIVKSLGYGVYDKEKVINEIYKKICSNYIYKLECKEIENKLILKFCVCIDMPTISGNFRKTTIALNYFPDSGEIYVITIT